MAIPTRRGCRLGCQCASLCFTSRVQRWCMLKRQTEIKPVMHRDKHLEPGEVTRGIRESPHYKPLTGNKRRKSMVFTLDKKKRPLGHCTPKRARQLIEKGRACVYKY